MKNVLLLVHDDPGQESRFQAALDIARALDGHLTCLDVAGLPVIAGDAYGFAAEAALIEDEREREAKNRECLEARLAREDVPWNWIDVTGSFASELQEAAKLADLIVVNRRLETAFAPDMQGIAAELVVHSGKAVVAVPEAARGFAVGGHAMVAFDGSDEAAKALQSAMPLLRLARSVTIVQVADGSIGAPAEDAAAYLSRHGVHAVTARRRPVPGSTADTLIEEARAEGAEYVVMGGFGRSRLVEAIFGGVSHDMLSGSTVPLIIAH
jgi:nucleotide-binding universal stress UspA family protein